MLPHEYRSSTIFFLSFFNLKKAAENLLLNSKSSSENKSAYQNSIICFDLKCKLLSEKRHVKFVIHCLTINDCHASVPIFFLFDTMLVEKEEKRNMKGNAHVIESFTLCFRFIGSCASCVLHHVLLILDEQVESN